MSQVQIDPEFAALIPTPTNEELDGLRKSLLTEGCRDDLVAWRGLLLDGHNRYQLCQEEKLSFNVHEVVLADRNAAIEWIIRNQFSRRNLTPYQRAELALKLKPIIEAKAKIKQQKGGGAVPQKSAEPHIETRKEIAREAGVSHDTITKTEFLQKHADEKTKTALRTGKTSINAATRLIKQAQNRTEKVASIQASCSPTVLMSTEKFAVILADPPWQYEHQQTESRKIENWYPTMPLADICALKIPTADNAVLYLWTTAPKLEQAFEVLKAWDFTYKTCAVWDKERIGQGYWFRIQHELLLVATKGEFPPPAENARVSSVIRALRTEHSKKPTAVYEIIENAFPTLPKLEMFSRLSRKGWTAYGNEVKNADSQLPTKP